MPPAQHVAQATDLGRGCLLLAVVLDFSSSHAPSHAECKHCCLCLMSQLVCVPPLSRKFDEKSELQQRKEEGRFPSVCHPNAPLEISRSCQRLLGSAGWEKLWSFLLYRCSVAMWTWAWTPAVGVPAGAGGGPGKLRRSCQPQPPYDTDVIANGLR